jgi:hypothetical protein
MKELINKFYLYRRYNKMPLIDLVKEFEEYTCQVVPLKAIEDFRFIGLLNTDFLFSDWLNNFELLNLLQFDAKMNGDLETI